MSESTGTVRVAKTSKVAVSIAEAAQDGSFVRLENGSASKEFDCDGWRIERNYGRRVSKFRFPAGYRIPARGEVKIWGAQFAEDKGANDLVGTDGECATWGTGNGAYKFIDNKDVTKATYELNYGAAR